MPDRAIAVETTIAAPFATVWNALRDPAEIRRWHGWEYEEGGGVDAEIDQIYVQGVEADAEAGTITIADGSRFEIHARDAGATIVRITMPAPTGGASWDRFYDDVREGWTSFVQQLRFALEQHPGADRRTLQLDGAGTAPADPPTLGLDDPAAGQPYDATTPWGERWSGRVLFRNEHQIVVSVDAYGPGLVVLHAQPPARRPPHGGGMAIVTAYGLDDDAFAALADRWTGWWRERYPATNATSP